MIDSTKGPVPVWKRYSIVVLLSILILAAGYMVWSKELHHNAAPTAVPPHVGQTSTPGAAPAASTPSTTIPGGIPISSRNPFGN